MARVWGVMALRLANADIVPLDYTAYADRVAQFIEEVTGESAADHRRLLEPLAPAARRFAGAAQAMASRIERTLAARSVDPAVGRAIDRALVAAEAALLDRDGLPGRPW